MCLSLLGRVVSVDPPGAVVEIAGVRRSCSTLMEPAVRPGAPVLVHAGYIVRTLTEPEAAETAEALAELGRVLPPRAGGPGGGAEPQP